ncbi:max-binding protein MNT [Corythoichthys intestinalis]|uniref:max-binding protein MNT n=1 Tax=Corythoichthys intestinalis TaxID=161448 RepID=UPI0025A65830|nr:max-binding protein MNT [Corythoichthys intestinalis]XP_061796939.1 max-binding protein MNT-like [Nerophis lumbriciformis]
MSIETLLEAAKYLELQAQQQQRAREDELKEKLRLDLLTEQRLTDVNKYNCSSHINNVFKAEELITERPPAPLAPSLLPPSMPIAVIPIPVVKSNPAGSPSLPVALLSHPATPPVISPKREPPSPQEQSVVAPPRSPQPKPDEPNAILPTQSHQHLPTQLLPQTNSANIQQQQTHQQLLHRYTGSIVSPPHQPAAPAQSLQPAHSVNGPSSRGSPPDDGRLIDQKKRPSGAGTREVHNKLEKNRRAHLKECFETLKKNIPNIDEKKTSNLSVLRSALRYIQTLKRKEKEYEHDMERLAREKIATQQHLEELKNELSQWMDVVEIDRVLRQTVQPEEDQASTSTASEGEEAMDEEEEDEDVMARPPNASPSAPLALKADVAQTAPVATQALTVCAPTPSFIAQRVSALQPPAKPPAAQPALHPTVIAHAPVSHPSVIQAVNHVIQAGTPKPMGHITVHPVAHVSPRLPALYPQPVAVNQPALISHIAHTLGHVNGTAGQPPATAIMGKQTVVAHHPQLVGQTVLNPVTMVTMPSFPISTLKLA